MQRQLKIKSYLLRKVVKRFTQKGTVEDFVIQELQKLRRKYVNLEEMKLKAERRF